MAIDHQRFGIERSQGSATEPDRNQHPAYDLLRQLGFDVQSFPVVRCVLETSEKDIRVGRMVFPLRVPAQPGYVYDSVARIRRTLEIPHASQKGHRKFVEIEWIISEEPSLDEENHAALSFLAAQLECVWCHEPFIPDPEIISDSCVRVSCPNCLNYWSISVAPQSKKTKTPELLLDIFQRDMVKLKKLIVRWTDGPVSTHDKNFFQYFPYSFEGWADQSAQDLLFEDAKGWTSLATTAGAKDFESLFRGFVNSQCLDYFKAFFASLSSHQLEQTEIQRKTDPSKKITATQSATQDVILPPPLPGIESPENTEKTPTQMPSAAMMGAQRFMWAQPTTQVKDVRLPSPDFGRAYVSRGIVGAATFLGLVLVAAVVAINWPSRQTIAPLPSAVELPPAEIPGAAQATLMSAQTLAAHSPEASTTQALNQQILAAKEAVIEDTTPPRSKKVAAQKSKRMTKDISREQLEIAESAFRQGMLHLKLQQAREAISEFQKVLALNPLHADAHRGLGLAEVYEQNFENAAKALGKYLELARNPYDRDSVEELIVTLKERTTKP